MKQKKQQKHSRKAESMGDNELHKKVQSLTKQAQKLSKQRIKATAKLSQLVADTNKQFDKLERKVLDKIKVYEDALRTRQGLVHSSVKPPKKKAMRTLDTMSV